MPSKARPHTATPQMQRSSDHYFLDPRGNTPRTTAFAFSLFELLIAMTIVGILSAISYPLYTAHSAKVNREQAEITLLEIGNRLEEEHTINGSYQNADIGQLIPPNADKLPYQFVIARATEHEYLIKAVPRPSQPISGAQCQTLTLASNGSHCW